MTPYEDTEIDDAIARVSEDIARRSDQPEFPAEAMAALVDQLGRMESARRAGDFEAARSVATGALPALELYRPSNVSARSKAIVVEVVSAIVGTDDAAT